MSELAPYAVDSRQSRGREIHEHAPSWRSEFQRDRDRVIHSSAFRRLEYKTQVFVNHEGDMFRTRLTHSLEVAQIARTIARALGVNEDLTEAIALAHDLGHTPFGHAGQAALNACMRQYGGFEHNLHSLRVVDKLEQRYPQFDGLNLLFETREGILKHCRPEQAALLGDLGQRFIERKQPSLEAQIANIADEIAYNHHDIDDGLRSGILSLESLSEHEVFERALRETCEQFGKLDTRRLIYTAIRTMLGTFADDLISSSRQRLDDSGCDSVETVRDQSRPLIDFCAAVRAEHIKLKRMLNVDLYRNPRVQIFTDAAAATVETLFEIYFTTPTAMPNGRGEDGPADDTQHARDIADYIAGMTDRFAIAEHRRLVGTNHWPEAVHMDVGG